MATVDLKLRVLGRVLSRDLAEREVDRVAGGHGDGGGICGLYRYPTDVDANGNIICDATDGPIP